VDDRLHLGADVVQDLGDELLDAAGVGRPSANVIRVVVHADGHVDATEEIWAGGEGKAVQRTVWSHSLINGAIWNERDGKVDCSIDLDLVELRVTAAIARAGAFIARAV